MLFCRRNDLINGVDGWLLGGLTVDARMVDCGSMTVDARMVDWWVDWLLMLGWSIAGRWPAAGGEWSLTAWSVQHWCDGDSETSDARRWSWAGLHQHRRSSVHGSCCWRRRYGNKWRLRQDAVCTSDVAPAVTWSDAAAVDDQGAINAQASCSCGLLFTFSFHFID